MLKVEITNRKAPWPAGAGVGSVVLLAVALLPAWAAGKCIVLPAEDEREPMGTWEPPVLAAEPKLVVNPASEAEKLAAAIDRIGELSAQLDETAQALGTARAEIASVAAERDAALADLQALREGAAKATKKGASA